MKAFLALPELAATAQHITTIQTTLDRLTAVKRDSWEQLLDTARRLYQEGAIGLDDLLVLLKDMAHSYGSGYTRVWDAVMPIEAVKVRHVVARARRVRPNGPNGSWSGTFPVGDQQAPYYNVPVVYVLFDHCNDPVYVGSTKNFRIRVKQHLKDKPNVGSWVAYPCRDREHAYELEVELLKRHKPRLNKKAGR